MGKCAVQLEKAHMQQWRRSADKKNKGNMGKESE